MKFQKELKQKEAKATGAIAMKIAGLVDKIARDRNLEIVFERNSAGVLYAKNPQDLTAEVIDAYDYGQSHDKEKTAAGNTKETKNKKAASGKL